MSRRPQYGDVPKGRKRGSSRTITCHVCKRPKGSDQFPRAGGKARGRGRGHDVRICQRCISKTPRKRLEEIKQEARDNKYPKPIFGTANHAGTSTTITLDYHTYGGLDINGGN